MTNRLATPAEILAASSTVTGEVSAETLEQVRLGLDLRRIRAEAEADPDASLVELPAWRSTPDVCLTAWREAERREN